VCAIPVIFRKALLGVLYVDRRAGKTPKNPFGSCDAAILSSLAQCAGALVEEELNAAEQKATREIGVETARRETLSLRAKIQADGIVGESPAIARLLDLIHRVAPKDQTTVLIRGETGTGKELVARAIHDNSPRRKGPFVAVNVTTLAPTVIESELFGNEPGAFTGAKGAKGLIRQAQRGTLFLDEIGDASPDLQAMLLRFLQERKVRPVGGNDEIAVDVRIVSATLKPLDAMVEQGTFRSDLLYRLNVVTIETPPLRERVEDIPLLVDRFCLEEQKGRKQPFTLPDATVRKLAKREWPGNVRELQSEVKSMLARKSTRPRTKRVAHPEVSKSSPPDTLKLDQLKAWAMAEAVRRARGDYEEAADLLGITERGLRKALKGK
jgi:transcriptional regulator with PAS, ATPase and Fis domain